MLACATGLKPVAEEHFLRMLALGGVRITLGFLELLQIFDSTDVHVESIDQRGSVLHCPTREVLFMSVQVL